MSRIFISLSPDDAITKRLAELQNGLDDVRWTPPEQFHLTLRFIGSIGPERIQEVAAVLGDIRQAPFDLTIHGVGTFPHINSRKNLNVLWVGFGHSPALDDLAGRIEDHLQMIGLRPAERDFAAHLTIGRIRDVDRDQLAAWLEEHDDLELPPFTVASFDLMNSTLFEEGAEYEVLEEYRLRQAVNRYLSE